MKFARMVLIAWRDLFMSPGPMSDCSFKQGAIFEGVNKRGLEEVEIWNRGVGVFQNGLDYNKRRKLV